MVIKKSSPPTGGGWVLVDYSSLVDVRPTNVRHDPHVRSQASLAPTDLRAASRIVGNRDAHR